MDACEIIRLSERMGQLRQTCARRALKAHGLHVGQPAMLEFVYENPGCSQREIADNAHVTPASVAASVKRLEKAGMLVRRGDTADTRCNRVYITPLGKRELTACREALRALDESMVNAIAPQDAQRLADCLQKMCEHLFSEKSGKSD